MILGILIGYVLKIKRYIILLFKQQIFSFLVDKRLIIIFLCSKIGIK